MKKILRLLIGIWLLSFRATAQTDDIETIKKLNEGFLHAIVNRDSVSLAKILADDFVLIRPDGIKQNKRQNLLNLQQNMQVKSVHIDSVDLRLLTPTVAVLTAWNSFAFISDGKTLYGKNCYQDVYAKRENEWKAVAAHVSLLNNR